MPAGDPEEVYDRAFRRYVALRRKVERQSLSWSRLPRGLKVEMDAVVELMRQGAGLGSAGAQNTLGYIYGHGEGVNKDDVEAYPSLKSLSTSASRIRGLFDVIR